MTKSKSTKRPLARKPAKAAAKRARPKPRTAKRRRAQPSARKSGIVRQRLEWRGVKLSVVYDPAYFPSVSYCSAHLEIRVLAPEDAPIPVTDTRFRSHFLLKGYVEHEGGPAAYVRAWLDREACSPAYRRALDRWRQFDLFAMPKS